MFKATRYLCAFWSVTDVHKYLNLEHIIFCYVALVIGRRFLVTCANKTSANYQSYIAENDVFQVQILVNISCRSKCTKISCGFEHQRVYRFLIQSRLLILSMFTLIIININRPGLGLHLISVFLVACWFSSFYVNWCFWLGLSFFYTQGVFGWHINPFCICYLYTL